MANVVQGPRTTQTKAAPAAPRPLKGGSAKAITDKVQIDEQDRPTYYTATTGSLQISQDRKLFSKDGEHYDTIRGLLLEFNEAGMSRPFYPAKSKDDQRNVELIDTYIESDVRTSQKIRLTKRGDLEAMPPFVRWDVWAPDVNILALQANFTDDHDVNQQVVRDAARYELQRGTDSRREMLAALDALLASEIAFGVTSDDIEVEL